MNANILQIKQLDRRVKNIPNKSRIKDNYTALNN